MKWSDLFGFIFKLINFNETLINKHHATTRGILHDCELFPPTLLCLRSTCLSNSSLFLNLRPQLISGHSNAVSGMSFISALISTRSPLISSSSSSLATSYTIKPRRHLPWSSQAPLQASWGSHLASWASHAATRFPPLWSHHQATWWPNYARL